MGSSRTPRSSPSKAALQTSRTPRPEVGGAGRRAQNLPIVKHLFASLIACLVLSTGVATARPPTFTSTTEGSPVSTLQGTWTETDGGRTAALQMAGGQLIGAGTRFKASWVTPWTTKGKRPSFTGSFNFESMNQLGDAYRLHWQIRFRVRGEKWSPWLRHSFGMRAGTFSGTGGGSAFGSFSKESYRFQWRLTGRVVKPTTLQGDVELRVN